MKKLASPIFLIALLLANGLAVVAQAQTSGTKVQSRFQLKPPGGEVRGDDKLVKVTGTSTPPGGEAANLVKGAVTGGAAGFGTALGSFAASNKPPTGGEGTTGSTGTN